jgi:hypothetical protein
MAKEDPTYEVVKKDAAAVKHYEAVSPDIRAANANDICFSMVLEKMPKIDLSDAKEVAKRTEDYMEKCVQFGKKPNLAGYALALGKSVHALEEMLADRRSNIKALEEIYKGISMIENILVTEMAEQRVPTVAGIFLLKNHFHYKDQADVNIKAITRTDTTAIEQRYESVVEI